LAEKFAAGAAERDRQRILSKAELDEFSGRGLWAISIPKGYGGAGVSHTTADTRNGISQERCARNCSSVVPNCPKNIPWYYPEASVRPGRSSVKI
jgi:alkylation response protein AidB-like acyl-CoA dehydrogenase